MMDVITIIVTAVCSGSLSWLFTLRYTRQQAKTDAMKSVQDVYQELIEDLRADRSSLRDKISDMEKQLQSLSDEVASNAKNYMLCARSCAMCRIALIEKSYKMNVSRTMIEALKSFEGCKLKAYRCPAGVPTIGYGHTQGVKMGQVITQAQADALLKGDLMPFEKGVAKLFPNATQPQFDALVDFAYNLGLANLERSTLRKKILLGADEAIIRANFLIWNKAGGKVLAGLTKRRQWEANRYFSK